ncbi:putative vacuolar-ATPase subunit [Basidiobolus meristosporus CBS 931.73]|uniref:V-type proton ATPase subunit a n=1 Tax=Basidiobolus meristosporus CBS 931.73 TaxID=1314790 RepID=A0A1Y1XZN3_9FUNG|nr:putative vacuolar-ATPase subunit [Basidiobolus meristosporus CBS 931.73]|eukprot:ORX91125.1 putative vacuolar-ATPase subunit [Basidiobolus meristosporus CBS 931.73]
MAPSTLFRSEEMSLIQLFIPSEVSRITVSHLGEKGLIQFRDLNPSLSSFQRSFVSEIKKLDDLERQLRILSEEAEKQDIPIPACEYDSPEVARPRTIREIDDLHELLNENEQRILQLNSSYSILQKQYYELIEQHLVLQETGVFFQEAHAQESEIVRSSVDVPQTRALLTTDVEAGEPSSHPAVGFVAGVMPRQKINTFERILWRSLRGNLFMKQSEIAEPLWDAHSDSNIDKNVFIIFSHGKELLAKIRKTAEAMGASLYPIDDTPEERRAHAIRISARIEDIKNIMESNNQTRRDELSKISNDLSAWFNVVKKEKALYHVMNLFNYDRNRKCLIAEGWCPTNELKDLQSTLKEASENAGASVYPIMSELQTKKTPPTYHRVNKFSSGFQSIVDAYGIARYGEVNPGLFTVISFPFLFAVMFGDLGHGIILSAIAGWMCYKEKALKKFSGGEMFSMMYDGRYIILLMGLFSIYTGFIYNDIFSRGMHLAPSSWEWPVPTAEKQPVEARYVGGTYYFGLDHAWHHTDNFLLFTNSYKMKMSVIFGVLQMSFGVILTNYNHVHFNHKFAIWAEFIPQILFMLCIFGYLSVTIIYKWLTNWSNSSISPPSLLNMLIYMFLSPGSVEEKDQLYPGQGTVQLALILIALVCVPWMLLAKPLVLKSRNKRKTHHVANDATKPNDPPKITDGENGEGSEEVNQIFTEEMEEEEPFDFGEIMIHQVIHTIEYCLNCISNTASYLRLWALSLAHAQLSSVLWEMILELCYSMAFPLNIVSIFLGFTIWFVLTLGILLVMEGLSAFLHALRLHWVEFNGKFYEGSGHKFTPFSFKTLFDNSEEQ